MPTAFPRQTFVRKTLRLESGAPVVGKIPEMRVSEWARMGAIMNVEVSMSGGGELSLLGGLRTILEKNS